MAVAQSRRQFSRTRAEVEQEIIKFHEPVVIPKKDVIPAAVRERVQENRQPPRREEERKARPTSIQEPKQERPKETHRDRPPTPRPPRQETNPEELRSILKRIAGQEEKTPEGPKERPTPSAEQRSELKDILKTVITENPTAVPDPAPVPTPQPAEPARPVEAPAPTQKDKDTLTPKELERMMRVTVHDKPPL